MSKRVNYGKRITSPVEGIIGENKVEQNKQALFDLKNKYSGAEVQQVHYSDPKYFTIKNEEKLKQAEYLMDHPELTLPPELRGKVQIPPSAFDVLKQQEAAEKKLKRKTKKHTKAKVKPNGKRNSKTSKHNTNKGRRN